MKEKRECKLVQDLLPNYVEKLTSEETNNYVEEHLKECEECTRVLESMQKDIKVDIPERDKKAVKFFKKYNRKLRTLGIILGVILAIYFILVIRRVVIIGGLINKADEHIKTGNYYARLYSHAGGQMSITEIYNKDDKCLMKMNVFTNEQVVRIIQTYDNEKSVMYTEGGVALITDSVKPTLGGHLYASNVAELILMSALGSVRSVKCNGTDCYLVEFIGMKEYVDKETGLSVKSLNGVSVGQNGEEFDIVVDRKYDFGNVTDEDVTGPDLSEYKMQDERSK